MNIKFLAIVPALVTSLLLSPAISADYLVVSDTTGEVCSGFFIESCHKVKIDAVGHNGKMYHPAEQYEDVSSYREKDDRCWIHLKGSGTLGSLISSLRSATFYTLENDKYQKVSPDYITFNCFKM